MLHLAVDRDSWHRLEPMPKEPDVGNLEKIIRDANSIIGGTSSLKTDIPAGYPTIHIAHAVRICSMKAGLVFPVLLKLSVSKPREYFIRWQFSAATAVARRRTALGWLGRVANAVDYISELVSAVGLSDWQKMCEGRRQRLSKISPG